LRRGERLKRSREDILVVFASSLMFFSACGANQEILNSGKYSPTPANVESPKSTLGQEIENMRTADFRFIWVLRRKDGGVIDAADRAIIRVNTVEINRRVLADEDKALVLGSNTAPFRENFDALNRAFSIQDLSPEPVPSPLPTREPTPKDPKIIR
jgi:hypothetical protein